MSSNGEGDTLCRRRQWHRVSDEKEKEKVDRLRCESKIFVKFWRVPKQRELKLSCQILIGLNYSADMDTFSFENLELLVL